MIVKEIDITVRRLLHLSKHYSKIRRVTVGTPESPETDSKTTSEIELFLWKRMVVSPKVMNSSGIS